MVVLVFLASCENSRDTKWSTTLPMFTGGGLFPALIGAAIDNSLRDKGKYGYAGPIKLSDVCAEAREGNGTAFSSVAWHYRNGWLPVAKDPIEAYKWFIMAEAAGYEAAARYRVDLASTMPATDVTEAARQAEAWTPTEETCTFVGEIAALNPPAEQPPLFKGQER